MTSTHSGKPEKKLSKRQRAAGAAALIAVTGLAGWAVAAGPLVPASEPMSRSMQAGGATSDPPGNSGSTVPGSTSSDPAEAPAPEFAPAPGNLQLQAPGVEAPAQEGPAAPGGEGSAPAPDPGAKGVAPPGTSGKIINEPPPVAAAKGFDKTADVAEGVTTKVRAMKAVNGEARGVGEVAGPALQFTLDVTNNTAAPVSLAEAVVNVEAGADRSPAELLSGPGAVPFPAEVAPGQKVSGVFVFQIPPEQRKTVRVLFHYEAVSPVAAFEGSVPLQGEAP